MHEAIPNMRSINLIPFHYDMENSVHFREVLYNVIVFIPAGFYFTEFFKTKGVWFGTIATALVSLLFEIIQWIFWLGN